MGEKVVAPLDRRAQGLLAWIGVATATEEVEALRDAVEDLLGRQSLAARGRKLDREWQPVEAVGDLGRGRVLDLELGSDRARPLPK
ncbi:MAG TPA: hypothetical protein VJ807_05515, partial [Gaiellaceae bacterium]|nr:hypothetical protein [Gaiellaceae bacterium]